MTWCGAAARKRKHCLWNACRTLQHGLPFICAAGTQLVLLGENLVTQPPSSWRDFHLAQHSCKARHGHHPLYLKCLLTHTSASHGHHTRQASTGSAHLPLPRTNFGKKAFSYSGAAMWNSLPSHARNASTISAFNSIVHPILLTT